MQAIFVVLNHVELLDEWLTRLKKAGVNGGTVLDSTGIVKSIDESDESYLLGSLRLFLDNPNTGIMFGIPVTFADGFRKK